jgi:hypothetical protein
MVRGLERPDHPVFQMNATIAAAAKGGKKVHKTKLKPHITLPDGDIAVPVAELAKEIGVTERTFKTLGIPLMRIGGCLYGSRRKRGEVLAERLNAAPSKRRGRR